MANERNEESAELIVIADEHVELTDPLAAGFQIRRRSCDTLVLARRAPRSVEVRVQTGM